MIRSAAAARRFPGMARSASHASPNSTQAPWLAAGGRCGAVRGLRDVLVGPAGGERLSVGPVRIVWPFSAGGDVDGVLRAMAESCSGRPDRLTWWRTRPAPPACWRCRPRCRRRRMATRCWPRRSGHGGRAAGTQVADRSLDGVRAGLPLRRDLRLCLRRQPCQGGTFKELIDYARPIPAS